ncbi:MAG TPA: nucleoside monophosphate kinase [Terriglobales bacterium]
MCTPRCRSRIILPVISTTTQESQSFYILGRLSRHISVLIGLAAMASTMLAAGPIVLIIGPPGSGRTTQAEFLRNDLGMTVIAVDDLIVRNKLKFQKYRMPTIQGVEPHLDPALDSLVEEALAKADSAKGVVLDGYPASKMQGDFLTALRQKLELPQPIVIHLSVPDNVVRSRLTTQHRPELEQQLKDYHREFDFVREYFPETDIHTVDGTRRPADVAKEIRKIVETLKK